MKHLLAVLLLISLASSVSAQERHWYKSKQWWAGEAMMTAAIVADAVTTAHRCHGCTERNPLIGSNPDNRTIALFSSANFGVQSVLHIWSFNLGKNDPNKYWRAASLWGQPLPIAALEFNTAYNNSQTGYQAYMKPVWIHQTEKP